MASNVSDVITAEDLGNGGILPTQYANEIIQAAPKSSVMLQRARRIEMSTRTRSQPVLDSLPLAYWVGGDTGRTSGNERAGRTGRRTQERKGSSKKSRPQGNGQ